MFIRYVGSKKSWIVLFVLLLALTDLLILLDKGISIQISSLVYLNVMLLLIFIGFFLWRYKKETSYTKTLLALMDEMSDDWLEALPAPMDVRDEAARDAVCAISRFYKGRLAENRNKQLIEHEYITSWVHEVKAPLTAMKLTIDANRQQPAMQKIEAEWLRIHLLIDQQLYIARLPSLDSDYVPEAAALHKLAAKEVRELASWCVEKNIAVEFEGEDVEVTTDSKWCSFIIRQILTNAVKYSPSGGTITMATETLPTGNVQLSIKDEGPGIAARDLPRIFDKGFTGGNGRVQHAATGLGLYLARTAAAKIGIALEAHSELIKGTVLRMTFTAPNKFESIRASYIS